MSGEEKDAESKFGLKAIIYIIVVFGIIGFFAYNSAKTRSPQEASTDILKEIEILTSANYSPSVAASRLPVGLTLSASLDSVLGYSEKFLRLLGYSCASAVRGYVEGRDHYGTRIRLTCGPGDLEYRVWLPDQGIPHKAEPVEWWDIF
ncbi:MAG: hypothetical protein ACPGO3_00195 [Magnetospiraceae bacterium]